VHTNHHVRGIRP
jgi:hypothetical protein